MKTRNCNFYVSKVWILIPVMIFLYSCGTSQWTIPSEYVGNWKTGKHRITVRYKAEGDKHSKFISDSAIITVKINSDKTASGFIGQAEFDSGMLKKNAEHFLFWETGVAYIIECGPIGKIFDSDPLLTKDVEIWLGPLNESGEMRSSLRIGGSVFPMAGMLFKKMDE
jgi:hypothetical protein